MFADKRVDVSAKKCYIDVVKLYSSKERLYAGDYRCYGNRDKRNC